jgi:SAM-dependent methyltransferase
VLATEVLAFVRASLPSPPARVLEVGAGEGELAAELRDAGYEVLAIDPASTTPDVEPIGLDEIGETSGSFDAAVAVLSLHHVHELTKGCANLGDVLPSGGRLIIDEFDVAAFDERAAGWWWHAHAAAGREHSKDPPTMVAELRSHLHPLSRIQDELSPYFVFGEPIRGAYLYRWDLPHGLRELEELQIAAGSLPATGARLLAIRAPTKRRKQQGPD